MRIAVWQRQGQSIRIHPSPGVPGGGLVMEVGVYAKRAGQWEEVVAETVNWKTGGTMKSSFSLGVVKKDLNGLVGGPTSRNVLTPPYEILLYLKEGESYGEYQLLRLREHDDSREFRCVTGGVFNQKGGAQRDTLTFEAKKVAPRTHVVSLKDIVTKGEYGILPPNLLTTTSASAQMGKIFTFRVAD